MKPCKLTHFLFSSLIFLCACKNKDQKTYAIRDFKNSLQPLLIKAISKGVVQPNDPVSKVSTDQELLQLIKSEHPLLRAIAFREILNRKSFNHFEIVMNHLDDTAFVTYDDEDLGVNSVRIADDILFNVDFKTIADKEKAINEVIKKHNHLRLAYTILDHIPLQERYYPYIREMARRIREADEYGDEKDFNTVEYALYGLARFKKPDDIALIKQKLCDNSWQIDANSFKIMQEFPNETYMDVLEKLYYDHYLRSAKNENGINSVNFINAIAGYKNERSAKILGCILDSVLTEKHFSIDRNYTNHELVYAIWSNPCKAYLQLRKRVVPIVLPEEKRLAEIRALYPQGQFDSIQFNVFPPMDSSENHIFFFK